jgi:hypothetical protein
MMRKYRISILCTLAVLSAVHADDRENTQYAASPTDHPQWQQTSTALLSRNDYLRIVNDNREIVQRRLQAYSESLLEDTGVYSPAVSLLGTAVSLAASDRRYSLNDSKTLGIVFRDAANSDRALLFEFRKGW